MSARWTTTELKRIAREGETEAEREKARELLESRGERDEVPEVPLEERRYQTVMEARR